MEVTKKLCNFFFFFSIAEISGTFLSSLDHYELAEQYSCMKYMNLFLDRAALITYTNEFHDDSTHFYCNTTVTSRTQSTGIIGVIQRMHLKKHKKCGSFFSFGDGEEDLCGEIIFGMVPIAGQKLPPAPNFISAYGGPFHRIYPTYSFPRIIYRWNMSMGKQIGEIIDYSETDASVNNRKQLLPSGAMVYPHGAARIKTEITFGDISEFQDGDILVAFTGYRDCDQEVKEGWFNCGYGLCILDQYVNDGIVNCPFGDCRDEHSCEKAMQFSPLMQEYLRDSKKPEKIETISNKLRRSLASINHISQDLIGFTEKYPGTADEVNHIGKELEKHNEILERISKAMEDAVTILDDRIQVREEVENEEN